MAERPIIFSGPMVRALLDGRKTQTRRLASSPLAKCSPGDRLWVRETWGCIFCTDDQKPSEISPSLWSVRYFADDYIRPAAMDGSRALPEQIRKKRPSIFMPRWASRLSLQVTDVRIEPLQSISGRDAEAEGIFRHIAPHSIDKVFRGERSAVAVQRYRELWESLHGKASWLANPDVVVLTFELLVGNADKLAA